MATHRSSLNIIVVGSGPAGLTCALDLAQRGHKVKLIEHSSSLRNTGGLYKLSPNAMSIITRLGLQDEFLRFGGSKSTGNRYRRYDTGKVVGVTNMDKGTPFR
jgi:salicylate hydroxylase